MQNLRIQINAAYKNFSFATHGLRTDIWECKFKSFFTSKYFNSIYNVKTQILDSPCKTMNSHCQMLTPVTLQTCFPVSQLGSEEQYVTSFGYSWSESDFDSSERCVTYRNYKAVKIQNKNNFLLKRHYALFLGTSMCLLQEWGGREKQISPLEPLKNGYSIIFISNSATSPFDDINIRVMYKIYSRLEAVSMNESNKIYLLFIVLNGNCTCCSFHVISL